MVKVGKNHKVSLVHLSHFTDGESGAWGHRAAAGLSLGPRWSAKILLVVQEVRELEQAGAKRPDEECGSLS